MTVLASEKRKELDAFDSAPQDLTASQGDQAYLDYRAIDDARATYEIVGGIMYGVGLASAAAGLVWMFLAEPDDAAFNLHLSPSRDGLSGYASWRF